MLVAVDVNLTQICTEPLPRWANIRLAGKVKHRVYDVKFFRVIRPGKRVPGEMLGSGEKPEGAMAQKKPTVERIIGKLRGYRRMHGCADGLPAQRNVQLHIGGAARI